MKSNIRTAELRINNNMKEDHHRYIDANFAVAKRKPAKIQACSGFEPLTSVIPVLRSRIELTSQLGAGR